MNANTSVCIAKDRLKSLLVSDRVNCTPDIYDKLQSELFHTISKYIEVDSNHFEITMSSSHIYIKLVGEE